MQEKGRNVGFSLDCLWSCLLVAHGDPALRLLLTTQELTCFHFPISNLGTSLTGLALISPLRKAEAALNSLVPFLAVLW